MCAGSLVSGYWFPEHIFQIALILVTDIVNFGSKTFIWYAWCLHFGTLEAHGTIQGAWGLKEGDLGDQAWILSDFELISESYFESCSVPLDQNLWFFHACFQITSLNDFGN